MPFSFSINLERKVGLSNGALEEFLTAQREDYVLITKGNNVVGVAFVLAVFDPGFFVASTGLSIQGLGWTSAPFMHACRSAASRFLRLALLLSESESSLSFQFELGSRKESSRTCSNAAVLFFWFSKKNLRGLSLDA